MSTSGRSLGGMKKPGHPIHVKDMDFLQPERAETSPPEDILKWYSPCASLLMVMGRRLETTMRWPCWPWRSREMESERRCVVSVGDMARKADGGCGLGDVGDVGETGEAGEGAVRAARKATGRCGRDVVVDVGGRVVDLRGTVQLAIAGLGRRRPDACARKESAG